MLIQSSRITWWVLYIRVLSHYVDSVRAFAILVSWSAKYIIDELSVWRPVRYLVQLKICDNDAIDVWAWLVVEHLDVFLSRARAKRMIEEEVGVTPGWQHELLRVKLGFASCQAHLTVNIGAIIIIIIPIVDHQWLALWLALSLRYHRQSVSDRAYIFDQGWNDLRLWDLPQHLIVRIKVCWVLALQERLWVKYEWVVKPVAVEIDKAIVAVHKTPWQARELGLAILPVHLSQITLVQAEVFINLEALLSFGTT